MAHAIGIDDTLWAWSAGCGLHGTIIGPTAARTFRR